jgi:hypothetical protein
MTRAKFPSLRKIFLGLTTSGASIAAMPAHALDLTSLVNSANTWTTTAGALSDQANKVKSMLPAQNPAAPQQQLQPAQQNGLQATPATLGEGRANGPGAGGQAAAGPMQVVEAMQIQWRADGCSFTQSQEITCQFTALNQGADKRMNVYPSSVSIVDAQGTEYRAAAGGFGQQEAHNALFANGVATVGLFHFRGVTPGVSAIKRFSLNGQTPVVWNDVALTSGGAGLTGLNGSSTASTGSGLLGALTTATTASKTTTTTTTSTTKPSVAGTQTVAAITPAASPTPARADHVRSARPPVAASATRATH